jgi:cyclophilin family peptidyl-prolyl cis-trans isomerase
VNRRVLLLATLLTAAVLSLAACGSGGAKPATTTAAPPATTSSKGPGNTKATPGIAVVKTSMGTFSFRFDVKDSPRAVASFEYLIGRKFFDGTIFHRIALGFVIQGGDPTGTGSGGPGYSTVDTVPPSTTYLHGTVAMAKTQTDPSGTAGSQFFVVTAANAGLPPIYAVIGHVVSGIAVVDKIGTFGNAQEQPTKRIVVQSITISP